MNLPDNFFKLVAFVLPALLFFSCEDPNEIGLELDPSNPPLSIKRLDIPLDASVILRDSINTSSGSLLFLGNYQSPYVGQLTATTYTTVIRSITPDIPIDAELDSIILTLKYNYIAREQIDAPIDLEVRIMSDTLDGTRPYYAHEDGPAFSGVLGTIRVDSAALSDSTLTLDVTNTLASTLFTPAKNNSPDFSDGLSFISYFKGLEFAPSTDGNVFFGIDTEDVLDNHIRMYYSEPEDTVSSRYDFYLHSFRGFTSIDVDRAGTALASYPADQPFTEFVPNDGNIYLQGLSGIYPIVDFGTITQALDTIDNFVLNRADFIIDGVVADEGPGAPLVLYPFYVRGSNEFSLPDTLSPLGTFNQPFSIQVEGTNPLGSLNRLNILYDSDDQQYSAQVTSYVEALSLGRSENDRVALYPAFYESHVRNAFIPAENIRVRVFYTTVF